MVIDLYYMPASPTCRAVQLVAASLGVELNLKMINLPDMEQMKPEFLKINPQHTIPTIVDNGYILYQSRSILAYLVNRYGKDDSLYPKSPNERAVVDQRLFFDVDLFLRFRNAYVEATRAGTPIPADLKEKFYQGLKWLDGFLEKTKWVAGNQITIADFSIVCSISTMDNIHVDLTPYPNLVRWYKDCQSTMKNYKEIDEEGSRSLMEMLVKIKAQGANAYTPSQ